MKRNLGSLTALCVLLLFSCIEKKPFDYAETFYSNDDQVDSVGYGYLLLEGTGNSFSKDDYPIAKKIPYHQIGDIKIFQGGIIVNPFETIERLELEFNRKQAQFFGRPYGQWKDGVFYYAFGPDIKTL